LLATKQKIGIQFYKNLLKSKDKELKRMLKDKELLYQELYRILDLKDEELDSMLDLKEMELVTTLDQEDTELQNALKDEEILLEEADKRLEEADKRLEEADKRLKEKDQELDRMLDLKDKELQRALRDKEILFEEADKRLDKRLEEMDKRIEEADRRIEEKDRLIPDLERELAIATLEAYGALTCRGVLEWATRQVSIENGMFFNGDMRLKFTTVLESLTEAYNSNKKKKRRITKLFISAWEDCVLPEERQKQPIGEFCAELFNSILSDSIHEERWFGPCVKNTFREDQQVYTDFIGKICAHLGLDLKEIKDLEEENQGQ